MQTKQYLTIEVIKDEFNFIFQMPNGATHGAAIDAAFEVLHKLNELLQQSIQKIQQTEVAPASCEGE